MLTAANPIGNRDKLFLISYQITALRGHVFGIIYNNYQN